MTELISEYKLLFTLLVFLLMVAGKNVIIRFVINHAKRKNKDRRSQVNTLKNLANLIIFVVLLNFWGNELQKFAFSIAAFVVAIVLVTRDFIQCLIGFLYQLTSRPFRIGDWVQIGEFAGEVNGVDWAKTTILEVDLETYYFTGKTLFVPNNQLVIHPIKNLNFLKRYVMHKFEIVRDMSVNPFTFIDQLREQAEEYCSSFKDVAVRYNQIIEKRLDVRIAGPAPKIQIATSELGNTRTEFVIFCPTDKALEIEQKLTQDFMQLWFAEREKFHAKIANKHAS